MSADRKPTPGALELQIAAVAAASVTKALHEALSGYDGPLRKLAAEVIASRAEAIRALLCEALDSSLGNETFRVEVKSAFAHSVARTLMSEYKGEIEKQAHALRQAPEFRARVVLAIEKLVKDAAGGAR